MLKKLSTAAEWAKNNKGKLLLGTGIAIATLVGCLVGAKASGNDDENNDSFHSCSDDNCNNHDLPQLDPGDEEFLEKCPVCEEGYMAPTMGHWHQCSKCGAEAEEDDYGLLWFEN